MFCFISFGSGSSGNCYYVASDDGALLIDAGVGIRMLKKHCKDVNIDLETLRAIMITHDHADHVKSVGSLSCEYNLPVYATRKVHERIDGNYLVRRKVEHCLRRNIVVGEPIELLGMHILTIPVPHDSVENVGYKIEYGGVTFVLLTDIGHVTPEIEAFVREANYLVVEANHEREMLLNGAYPELLKARILSSVGHLSNDECGKLLALNASPGLRHVWLCHLSNDNNDPELARYTVADILRSHGIIAGRDFKLDVLKRHTPSSLALME
ncbi:MAG: MBL fold metallo-hydrolase [Prevotella sp.]|nr:MBL fold metallo-hydrolase [Prevotella sp.]